MLARTFKEAKNLRISEQRKQALIEVLYLLEDEKIPNQLFDMSTIGGPSLQEGGQPCGTPGCILGWALAVDPSFSPLDRNKIPLMLHPLFFPDGYCHPGVTMIEAAHALRNFLETGYANWRKTGAEKR
jgi:hypothetical protein